MLPAQHRDVMAAQTLPSFEFVSVRHGTEVVPRIVATGPIFLKQRLPVYEATLAVNPSSTYFCILDNSAGHENNLSFADILLLTQKLLDGVIECIYGATVTADPGYPAFVDLMSANHSARNMKGELLATNDLETAEAFIAEKLRLVAAGEG